ncbi:MAG: ABC transporter ATP-binding protein [Rhodospirillaceae bacterium]|nr:ABC transporter ATP-binding protein [Rhodospirillaceae bacterium]
MGADNIVEIENLTVEFAGDGAAVRAVDTISLSIPRGSAVGLVGESGSGKSTVVGALLGLLAPQALVVAGTIRFDGINIARLPKAQRRSLLGSRIGTVFQDPFASLNPAIRVGRQITEPLIRHRRVSRMEAAKQVRALLHDVGFADPAAVMHAYPHQLSGGMQQRALIATAIVCGPSLLVLDEPTTALDVTIEAQILDLLKALRRSHGLSMLFVSHNLGAVKTLCDRVDVMYAGQIVERSDARTIFSAALHPYTKGLIASIPRLDRAGRRSRLAAIPGKVGGSAARLLGCRFEPRCPFAADRCRTEPQRLIPHVSGGEAACWRLDELRETAWPVATNQRANRREAGTEVLIDAEHLGKIFSSARLRLNLDRRIGAVPLRWHRSPFRAVDDVSLTIGRGEVLGLVGESGSGKTTLGRLLLHLIPATVGSTRFDGEPVDAFDRRAPRAFRRNAQIVFQNPDSSLNPRHRVEEIVRRPIVRLTDASMSTADRRVDELLELVQLPHAYRRRYPHELSGGEKQRVGIARALATNPRFIVCDEPVSALDVSVQATIVNLLDDLRAEFELAYLFISHNLAVVAHIADRIAIMYRGRICEMGTRDEILDRPSHPYTRTLLSSLVDVAGNPSSALDRSLPRTPPCGSNFTAAAEQTETTLTWLSDTHWMRSESVPDAGNDGAIAPIRHKS